MPNHKSCKKRMKTSAERRLANRAGRSELRNAIKAVRAATSKEQGQELLQKATALLDRAALDNLVHRRNADRNKSRLALFVQKLH